MSLSVQVRPKLLRWARERARLTPSELARSVASGRVERVLGWEESGALTLSQLEKVAKRTRTPLGYLFLEDPPEEALPIADFRTFDGSQPQRPSPELLDTVQACQSRQEWYREELIQDGAQPLGFVASRENSADVKEVAVSIASTLRLTFEDRKTKSFFSLLGDRAEDIGVLIMRNGVVGDDTTRKLEVEEFRGFCLSDSYAPLIFINANDSETAQTFTLAHELAHVWRGESGVSEAARDAVNASERFCNAVAAELLMPREEIRFSWDRQVNPAQEARRLARIYRISPIAMLTRALEVGFLDRESYEQVARDLAEMLPQRRKSTGGNYYNTKQTRIGRRFARSVIVSTLEGRTSFTEAFDLLGVSGSTTFYKLASALGVKS